MPLNREVTSARASVRGRRAALRPWWALLLAALALTLFGAAAWAQGPSSASTTPPADARGNAPTAEEEEHDSDEAPHHLNGQALCLDDTLVTLAFDEVDSGRARGAEAALPRSLSAQVRNALRRGGVRLAGGGCSGSDAYVSLLVQVAGLDPAVYTHHGPDSFSIAVSLQVGRFADSSTLLTRNVLPDMTFLGFQESVASEAQGAAPFEQRVGTTTAALVQQLVDAWHQDNP